MGEDERILCDCLQLGALAPSFLLNSSNSAHYLRMSITDADVRR